MLYCIMFFPLVLIFFQMVDRDNDYLNYHKNFIRWDQKSGQKEARKLDLVSFYCVIRSQWICPDVPHSARSKSSFKQIQTYKMSITFDVQYLGPKYIHPSIPDQVSLECNRLQSGSQFPVSLYSLICRQDILRKCYALRRTLLELNNPKPSA